MFCVHVAGDELGALTHDFRQNGFAISVNGCHLDQFNDASPRVPCVVRLSPSRFELGCPLADQLTLQRPPLLIRQIGYSDLQHYFPLIASNRISIGTRSAFIGPWPVSIDTVSVRLVPDSRSDRSGRLSSLVSIRWTRKDIGS